MSQENVELLSRMFESFSPLRTEELQSVLDEFVDPDVDWRAVEGAVDDIGGMRGGVGTTGTQTQLASDPSQSPT